MSEMNDRSIDLGPLQPQPDDHTEICRCEEISKGEIRQAIHDGMFTMTEIKRFVRAGMGLCQGRRCGPLVQRILAAELGVSPGEIEPPTSRPPARPTRMDVLANELEGGS
jgi:NAD(P)H-nitrite reductase large subunit